MGVGWDLREFNQVRPSYVDPRDYSFAEKL